MVQRHPPAVHWLQLSWAARGEKPELGARTVISLGCNNTKNLEKQCRPQSSEFLQKPPSQRDQLGGELSASKVSPRAFSCRKGKRSKSTLCLWQPLHPGSAGTELIGRGEPANEGVFPSAEQVTIPVCASRYLCATCTNHNSETPTRIGAVRHSNDDVLIGMGILLFLWQREERGGEQRTDLLKEA